MHPFQVTEETREMVMQNICFNSQRDLLKVRPTGSRQTTTFREGVFSCQPSGSRLSERTVASFISRSIDSVLPLQWIPGAGHNSNTVEETGWL
jgi:hypothetical protein